MQWFKHIPDNSVPQVLSTLCRACGRCEARRVCPSGAVVILDRGEQPWIDGSRCQGCRACVAACPHGAVSVPDAETIVSVTASPDNMRI